ncbi:Reticulon-like protein 1 [Lachnellula arida]|uniref:Reticulon-like protein n=1 Tax=Lachnellula arida TaxID=1316785 RepID=A0A8T9B0X4_9HELO|nr:Reticulon-like protein 1 [Lachnellula arida]
MSDFTSNDTVVPSIENNNTNGSLENAKNSVVNNASAAANAVANHPLTQSVTNGPVADNVKDQHAKTQAEFSNLAAARTTPTTPAATGQQLTHYHSFFSSLLSWDNPRASGIAFASVVLFIFAARYLDILRYAFKVTWMTLGVTVLAEAAGKALFSHGFTSQIRPRKYYTVSKSTLNSLVGDLHELINFFVIESQRIVFAENVFASGAAFLGAFISYYLIKFVPFWGLSLISTFVLFLTPLIYKTNKEVIDQYLHQAADIANQQTEQVRQLASHHASRATETTKQYVGDYSQKAQEMIGNARGRSTSPVLSAKPVKTEPFVPKTENTPIIKSEDFPAAPKEEFVSAPAVGESANALRSEDEPLLAI